MAKHYLDFVGLNTFIYEPVNWNGPGCNNDGTGVVVENHSSNSSGVPLDNNLNTFGWNGSNFTGFGGAIAAALNTFLCPYQEVIEVPYYANDLKYYKNHLFSPELSTTASFFPALMIKRNGPYGFPTWKQTRISENPLSRKQRKENIFTFVTEPGNEVVMNNSGKLNTIRGKYGSIQKYVEAPVSSRYKPFVVGAATITDTGSLERFELVSSYGNETAFFNNNQVNNYYNKTLKKSEQYEQATGYYLNGGLEKDGSPIDVFEYFKYSECVYPPRVYQYKDYTRQRTTFSFPWRDDREDRLETALHDFGGTDFYGPYLTQSMWILDARTNWTNLDTASFSSNEGRYRYHHSIYCQTAGGLIGTIQDVDYGILQNIYNTFYYDMRSLSYASGLDEYMAIAPTYNYKHTLTPSSSVVSPNGMKIEGINTGSTMGNMGAYEDLPSGEAKWEAGSQSGLNPFYDSYDKYINGVRQYGKDYTIIPEFRISEHVETYQSKGAIEEVANLFSLTGALSNTFDSSAENFYKIYSTSEFMKHFEVVKKDHKEFVDPMSITLKCKAVKKFLPYEGFYPAQRSVDLAKQFYYSYRDFVATSGSNSVFNTNDEDKKLFQNLMVPMFAPGIFFNTIKSGVAVDYPLIDNNIFIDSYANGGNIYTDGDDYYLINSVNGLFNRRIPFEAIVEPEKHIGGSRVYCNEPHLYANNSGSVFWYGGGNNLYKLMSHNFLAETNNFFMKNERYTTIESKPSSDPNVGLAEAGKTYSMRVKMYKSTDSAVIPRVSGSNSLFIPPQYSTSSRETFTMYSRPSAFGPPQLFRAGAQYGNSSSMGDVGYNYAFTPPYYYGQAFCDISFTATESRKYSFEEIIASSSYKQWRHVESGSGDFGSPNQDGEGRTFYVNGLYDDDNTSEINGLHLNSSVNLFSQKVDAQNSVDPNNPATRWVIQTKFETPMLNFNHLSASDSITLPNNASQSVPRGMWHQYGLIEEDSSKGIFLQVDDVPKDWIDGWLRLDSSTTGSLAELCGFSTEATRLGEIKDSKTVFEAVVAVPFIEQEGQRYFFRIARNDVARAFSTPQEQNRVGESVKEMLQKIRKYVLPPPLDFINNPQIDPFAMYVFEFKHTFTKQDLANIWQNLYPEIGQTFEVAESSISHQLLAHELLGGGAVLNSAGELDTNAVGNEIPDRVRWMVFKVKQRAKINYYEKIYGREDAFSDAVVSSQGQNVEVSYNWPYDYFSLVELAKIEAETKFAQRPLNSARQSVNITSPIARTDLPNLIARNKTNDMSPLFDKAASGELPTLRDIPQTIIQGGSSYFAPTNLGSVGRASNAEVNQTFTEIDATTAQIAPGVGGNQYGNTALGDVYYSVQSGMGPAGQVNTAGNEMMGLASNAVSVNQNAPGFASANNFSSISSNQMQNLNTSMASSYIQVNSMFRYG
jgi:hypothetical protein